VRSKAENSYLNLPHCTITGKTRNAWKSLAYSSLGAVVSPLANTYEETLK